MDAAITVVEIAKTLACQDAAQSQDRNNAFSAPFSGSIHFEHGGSRLT